VKASFVIILIGTLASACNSNEQPPTTPTSPTPPSPPAAVTVTSVAVTGGTTTFTERGATTRFSAMATLSNGATEDRTAAAAWASDNTSVATVSSDGTVTAQGDGQATISATVSNVRGTRGVSVSVVRRTPDPAAGQRLPLPANLQRTIEEIAGRRPELIAQSCPRGLKYVTNPWLDYMVDELRKLDTRWGYNAKPNRSAADNNGVPVVAAGDEIAYHFSGGADEGSADVYLIDILLGHCGSTPSVTFRHFTGEEPGRWTGAGRF
jgi:hypothetical protein